MSNCCWILPHIISPACSPSEWQGTACNSPARPICPRCGYLPALLLPSTAKMCANLPRGQEQYLRGGRTQYKEISISVTCTHVMFLVSWHPALDNARARQDLCQGGLRQCRPCRPTYTSEVRRSVLLLQMVAEDTLDAMACHS